MGFEIRDIASHLKDAFQQSVIPKEVAEKAGDQGSRLGKYVILEKIATGGFASVWKGYDTSLNRYVALKLIEARNAISPEELITEAKTVAALEHPNIVPIYEAGREEEKVYIAMKYVQGVSLDKLITPTHSSAQGPGRAEIGGVLMNILKVCEALSYAHSRGVIHRDIKPHNILVDNEGQVFVVDFGIARHTGLTYSTDGLISGTPNYMSPEQVESGQVDFRSDIYSLGATLYHCVTGRQPHGGSSTMEIIIRAVEADLRRPADLNRAVSADLEKIIMKAMNADLHLRYQSVQELKEDIERCVSGAPLKYASSSVVDKAFGILRRNKVITIAIIALITAATFMTLRLSSAASADKLYDLGLAYYSKGDLTRAKALFIQALDSYGSHTRSMTELASIYWVHEKNYEEAISLLQRALEIDESNIVALADLCSIYSYKGEYDRALEFCNRAMKVDPNEPKVVENMGVVNYLKGDLETAFDLLRKAVSLQPNNPATLYNLGTICLELGYLDEAIENFEYSVKLKPEWKKSQLGLALAYVRGGKAEEAFEIYDMLIARDPRHAEAYYRKGKLLGSLNRLQEAADNFDSAIKLEPDYIDAHFWLGQTYFALKWFRRAAESLLNAISLDNHHEEATNLLITTVQIFLDDKLYNYAVNVCRRLLEYQDNNALALYHLGIASLQVSDTQGAASALERLENIDPNLAERLKVRISAQQGGRVK